MKESVQFQYVTVVNSEGNESAVLEELEVVYVIHLWTSRDGLPSGLRAFLNPLLKMGDSFNPVVPDSCHALFMLGENRLHSFV